MKTILIPRDRVAHFYGVIRQEELSLPYNSRSTHAMQWAKGRAVAEALEKTFPVSIHAEQDHEQVRGNAIASGDDEYDKKVEDKLIARLDEGDVWAWASVTVSVSFTCDCCDSEFSGEDHLGCCSYLGETDFKRGGYYEDMIQRALDESGYPYEIVFEQRQ